MRWFIAGIVIGLLVLELKVLGGCGAMRPFQQKVETAPMPGAGTVSVAQATATKSGGCGCGGTASIAPGQAKTVLSSPVNFPGQQLGNRVRAWGGPFPQPSV